MLEVWTASLENDEIHQLGNLVASQEQIFVHEVHENKIEDKTKYEDGVHMDIEDCVEDNSVRRCVGRRYGESWGLIVC